MISTPADDQHPVGVDTRDMLVVHDALRGEFALLPGLVRAVAPQDTARARKVADHVELLFGLLHHHHHGEDRLLWPVLLARVPADLAPLVEPMEHQHAQIHLAQEETTELLQGWRRSASSEDRDRLATALEDLTALMREHLACEEAQVLPLAGRHLTEPEWRRLGEEGMAGVPKHRLPLVLGMLMQRGDPQVIAHMLAHLPAPARLLLPRLAVRVHARYARRLRGTATP